MKKVNLRLDVQGLATHPQNLMKSLGIEYILATPQSMGVQWWFWGCTNVPDPLPEYLTILDVDPLKAVGYGLSAKDANMIIDFMKEHGMKSGDFKSVEEFLREAYVNKASKDTAGLMRDYAEYLIDAIAAKSDLFIDLQMNTSPSKGVLTERRERFDCITDFKEQL